MPYKDSNVNGGKVRIKTSMTSGETLSSDGLVPGELALQAADGLLYYKDSNGSVQQIGSDTVALKTDSYIICEADTPIQDSYNLAKALTPNGSALSASNRAAVLVMPGVHSGAGLVCDTDYVDVLAVGSSKWTASAELATGSNSSVSITANDVVVVGLKAGRFTTTAGGANRVLVNCVATVFLYYADELTQDGDKPAVFSGTIINCMTEDDGNGTSAGLVVGTFGVDSVFNGTVEGCKVGGLLGTFTSFQGVLRNTTVTVDGVSTYRNVPFDGGTEAGSGIFQGQVEFCSFPNLSTTAIVLPSERGGDTVTAYGSTCTISNASPAVVTLNGHKLVSGAKVQFTTDGALPTGLSASTTYYAQVINDNTFKVSDTVDGDPIDTSSAGSGTHTAIAPTGKDGGWYSYLAASNADYSTT